MKHVDGDAVYRYPSAGDDHAPLSTKCLLLTIGGVCVVGTWNDNDCIAWAPLPKRNKDKERFCEQLSRN